MTDEFKHLLRIAGTDIDGNKRAARSLTKIKGIGPRVGMVACELAGIDYSKKAGNITDKEAAELEKVIENFQELEVPTWLLNRRKDYETGKDLHNITSNLMLSLRNDINLLRKIRSYRGIRHELGLPVRGQRTKSSFRKGITVGVSRRKVQQAAKSKKKERGK